MDIENAIDLAPVPESPESPESSPAIRYEAAPEEVEVIEGTSLPEAVATQAAAPVMQPQVVLSAASEGAVPAAAEGMQSGDPMSLAAWMQCMAPQAHPLQMMQMVPVQVRRHAPQAHRGSPALAVHVAPSPP